MNTYLHFGQSELSDLTFAKSREILLVNALGSYTSTTLATCNTRKYHGLLVAPQPHSGDLLHVLLSNVDETLITARGEFALGVHQYPGAYYPEGHRFLEEFDFLHAPQWRYRADGIELTKHIVLSRTKNTVLIKYCIHEGCEPFTLRLQPFLAFRNIHALRAVDPDFFADNEIIPNGIRCATHGDDTPLFLQTSTQAEFANAPDWYHDVEYSEERDRGYESREALYVPGHFDVTVRAGDEVVFAAGTEELNPHLLKQTFSRIARSCAPLNDFSTCLDNAARQFLVKREQTTAVIAGWHWFGSWGRDTFIALPGLTLARQDHQTCRHVLDAARDELKDGLFPNMGAGPDAAYNSVDAPLWYFHALQRYAEYINDTKKIWHRYGDSMRNILEHYRKGTRFNIHMMENGLLWQGTPDAALTWMDAVVDGEPVTPRTGLAVEINALWYNAVRFAVESALDAGDLNFVDEWADYIPRIAHSFIKTFWDEYRGYLADCVGTSKTDWSIRPNQVIAISLPYSPLDKSMAQSVLAIAEKHLLTPRGLRTLSPEDPMYVGTYGGDQRRRDRAYHQGTVWPWLFGPYADAYLRVHGDTGVPHLRGMLTEFMDAVKEYGLGTIAELYDGDLPQHPCGAIAQAWSVAEILRIYQRVWHMGLTTDETFVSQHSVTAR